MGTTPHDALLAEAYAAGRRAGLNGLPMSIALGEETSLEKQQWVLGWRSGNDQRVYQDSMWAAA